MKKIYGFMAIFLTVFMLAFSPAQKVEAGTCDATCLLQMGNSTVQNLGSQLKSILATIQKTVMGWLEDAKAWLDKYAQKAWSSLGLDKMSTVKIPDSNIPNLASKEKGFASGKSYKISGSNPVEGAMTSDEAAAAIQDKSVNSGTAAMNTGKLDKIAAAKQDELLMPSGSYVAAQYEEDKKLYIAQQEAIDALAKALVAKNLLTDLSEKGSELDQLFAAIQGSSVTKPEPSTNEKMKEGAENVGAIGGALVDTVLSPIKTLTGEKDYLGDAWSYASNRDEHTVMKNNLRVRFMYDKLLILKQQLLATRVKNAAARGIREMDPVAKVSPIEIIVPQALPKPTDKVQTPAQ